MTTVDRHTFVCDRCGTEEVWTTSKACRLIPTGWTRVHQYFAAHYSGHNYRDAGPWERDLCPECSEYITRWLKG